ncbi:hypothetical protein [Novosphingobium sp.]|uniref:hypothetical protein n=1 Tax=Novosphingobium sp. TaxID=1874826 RepID=UPI00333F8E56
MPDVCESGSRSGPPRARTGVFAAISASWRWFALAGYAAWVLLVGSHHEPWFDEAQAWLLARDNDLWPLLVQHVRYEGSPGLWHAVLWIAMRAGVPYAWLFILPAGFAMAGAGVILWRAPFPAPLRVLLLTSYFYGYQFSVVARGYCLDLLLVPLAATCFADRIARPVRYAVVIGLIANTNAHGVLVAGVLALELAVAMARRVIGGQTITYRRAAMALAIAGGLIGFALFCTWQPADNNFPFPQLHGNHAMRTIVFLCNAFVDHIVVWNAQAAGNWDIFASVILTLVLQRPVIALVAAGKNRAMAAAVVAVLLLLAVFVHAAAWHSGVFFLFWLFIVWVEWPNRVSRTDRRQLVAAIALIASLQTVQTVRTGLWDIANVYATGAQAAAAVSTWRAAHPGGRVFGYGDYAFVVQPWLGGNAFANYHGGAPRPSYVRWNMGEPWMAGSWQATSRMDFWQTVLAARPDLIVASPVNRNGSSGHMANLVQDACRAGYGVADHFPGTMVWRGRLSGDQSLYVFARGSQRGCAVP